MLDVIYLFGANSYRQQDVVDTCFGQGIRSWYVMFKLVSEAVGKFAANYKDLIGPQQMCQLYRVVDNDDLWSLTLCQVTNCMNSWKLKWFSV